MKIRTRLILAFLLVIGVGFYFLTTWLIDGLRPRYLATMEECMVDMAELLAGQLSKQAESTGVIDPVLVQRAYDSLAGRRIAAKIYELEKTQIDLRVYVTDISGIVIFDSDGKDEGKDFSKWNDVLRTMRGEYGARTTRRDAKDPRTSTLYVAAPIRHKEKVIGTLSVGRSVQNVNLFLDTAKRKIVFGTIWASIIAILLGTGISLFITRPLIRLKRYARRVRDGKRVELPKLGSSEIGELGKTFEEMREALEGKKYVEKYVQTLTHEIKGPLSAIRGAAELLEEDLPAEDRKKFVTNISTESERIEMLIQRMLQLSALEKRRRAENLEIIHLNDMLADICDSVKPLVERKRLDTKVKVERSLQLRAEAFLLRQALTNLLQNAIDFSNESSIIEIAAEVKEDELCISFADYGPGIPAYAKDKIFERFYSIQRPDSGKKSSGLGLSIVQEVATLHEGRVEIENRPNGGTIARFYMPTKLEG